MRGSQYAPEKKTNSLFSKPINYEWYLSLKKPSIVPPSYVFSVVWTTLYTLIALSLYSYLKANDFSFDEGITYFCVQMFGNAIFYHLFFKFKMLYAALADCILIILFTALTIDQFKQKDEFSAKLLYPYMVWLFIALYFMCYIVLKNR
jgi:benzodiazapine receptor